MENAGRVASSTRASLNNEKKCNYAYKIPQNTSVAFSWALVFIWCFVSKVLFFFLSKKHARPNNKANLLLKEPRRGKRRRRERHSILSPYPPSDLSDTYSIPPQRLMNRLNKRKNQLNDSKRIRKCTAI